MLQKETRGNGKNFKKLQRCVAKTLRNAEIADVVRIAVSLISSRSMFRIAG